MKLQNIIVFMGAPGSGKGTQTQLLAKDLGYAYFSTGELAREYAQQDTDFGREVKSIIDQGIILPIEIIRQIFTKKFAELLDRPGIILDGFPRTIQQVQLLDEIMVQYQIPNLKVLFLSVDKQKLIDRILKRGSKAGRMDDNPAVVEKRFDEYLEKTAAVKEYYEKIGKLIQINGDQAEDMQESINKVHAAIMAQVQ